MVVNFNSPKLLGMKKILDLSSIDRIVDIPLRYATVRVIGGISRGRYSILGFL
jgi:hypothetical protein